MSNVLLFLLYIVIVVGSIAWFALLPAIGLLWSLGWLS